MVLSSHLEHSCRDRGLAWYFTAGSSTFEYRRTKVAQGSDGVLQQHMQLHHLSTNVNSSSIQHLYIRCDGSSCTLAKQASACQQEPYIFLARRSPVYRRGPYDGHDCGDPSCTLWGTSAYKALRQCSHPAYFKQKRSSVNLLEILSSV